MNRDFVFHNPTKIYFGRHSMLHLEDELKKYGPNVLLAYGGGSIKTNGIYDEVIKALNNTNKNIVEFSGIMPNPTLAKMKEGMELVRTNKIDLILAVGGGSVIDLAKGVSVSTYARGDAFERYWLKREEVDNEVVPVGAILTMAGTGSEMNGGSVITDEKRMIKVGRVFTSFAFPKFAILNPTYTFTVSHYQMCSGIFDAFSHMMEQYFSDFDNPVTDYVLESLMRALIDASDIAVKNHEDYEARSNIMWISTLALNTITGLGKTQDWEVHAIEHQISAFTNCAHGMGLAAISPAYYRYILPFGLPKFKRFAINVFNIDPRGKTDEDVAREGIDALDKYIVSHDMPNSLRKLGVERTLLSKIADSVSLGGGYKKLTREDVYAILFNAYENE